MGRSHPPRRRARHSRLRRLPFPSRIPRPARRGAPGRRAPSRSRPPAPRSVGRRQTRVSRLTVGNRRIAQGEGRERTGTILRLTVRVLSRIGRGTATGDGPRPRCSILVADEMCAMDASARTRQQRTGESSKQLSLPLGDSVHGGQGSAVGPRTITLCYTGDRAQRESECTRRASQSIGCACARTHTQWNRTARGARRDTSQVLGEVALWPLAVAGMLPGMRPSNCPDSTAPALYSRVAKSPSQIWMQMAVMSSR